MAFLEEQLSPRITNGARSTVTFHRTKTYTIGGRMRQQFNWSNAIRMLDLSYAPRPMADYDELRDFFYVVMAGAHSGFRAKDWSDYLLTADNSSVTETDDGWQIQRVHTVGANEYLQPVKKPRDGVVIYNASDDSEVGGATVDTTTGLVSGLSAGTYYAVGEFDIPVTFVNDDWCSNFMATADNLFLAAEPIQLEEIRL